MANLGTAKFLNSDKGLGFVQPDDGGNDAFVYMSAVERAGLVSRRQDQCVEYDLTAGRDGRVSAINLQAV